MQNIKNIIILMKIKTWIWVAALGLLLISACTDKLNSKIDPPDDLIPRDTMIDIMVDLRLMDGIVIQEQRQANAKVYDLKYQLNFTILEKYGITKEQFESSFNYYQSDLDVIDEMFAEAITRLTKMKNEIEEKE